MLTTTDRPDAELMTVATAPQASMLKPALKILVPTTVVALLLFFLTRLLLQPPPPLPAPPPKLMSSGVAQSYAEAVARADDAVEGASARAKAQAGNWLPLESLGRAQFARARLTGDLASYAGADDSFTRAFAGLEPGIGPHLSRAEFSLGVHRLAAAVSDLDALDHYAVKPDDSERAEIVAMRGDVAFYRGNYEGARRLYGDAETIAANPGIDLRFATHAMRLGKPEDALRYLDRAEHYGPTIAPQLAARIALQRGMVERSRGDWDAATRHFASALKIFPGWWPAEQQSAAMMALRGDMPGAIRRFTALAARTNQPEPMDALAALYRASGDVARSRLWSARAALLWEERLKVFPDAFALHAIDHLLAFGDAARALTLARAAFAARPFGETGIALASALLANGQPVEALAMLDRVHASGWVTAEQHLLSAQALAMLGRGAEAEKQRADAREIDPHSSDRNPALLWFDH